MDERFTAGLEIRRLQNERLKVLDDVIVTCWKGVVMLPLCSRLWVAVYAVVRTQPI